MFAFIGSACRAGFGFTAELLPACGAGGRAGDFFAGAFAAELFIGAFFTGAGSFFVLFDVTLAGPVGRVAAFATAFFEGASLAATFLEGASLEAAFLEGASLAATGFFEDASLAAAAFPPCAGLADTFFPDGDFFIAALFLDDAADFLAGSAFPFGADDFFGAATRDPFEADTAFLAVFGGFFAAMVVAPEEDNFEKYDSAGVYSTTAFVMKTRQEYSLTWISVA